MGKHNPLIEKYEKEKDYDNLLITACKFNDSDAFALAMSKDANVNAMTEFGQTPVMFALENSNWGFAKVLKGAGADFSKVDTNGNTLYHYALKLDYKADKDTIDEKKIAQCVNLITKECVENISAQNSAKVTPLHLACRYGLSTVMEELLVHGANPNVCDAKGDTPLAQLYIGKSGVEDDILFDFGADVNVNEWQRCSVLYRVLTSNMSELKKKEIADKLIEKGASIEAMQLEYLLDDKIAKGVQEYAEMLMRKQLRRRIEERHDDVAKKFISREQYEALYEYFVSKRNFKDAKLLIQMGMNINTAEKKTGDTRLINAVKNNDNEYVIFLIENGAYINMRNKEGKSATEFAIESGLKDIALYLMEHSGRIYVDKPTFDKCVEKMGAKYEDLLHRSSVIFLGNKEKHTGIYADTKANKEKGIA